MTSENTLTGRNGHVTVGGTEVARITIWSVNPTLSSTNEWGDSDSAGYTNRSAGRRDCTFDCEGKYDSTNEVFDLFVPGDTAAVRLYIDETSLYWDFPRALCMDFNLNINVDTEEVVGWTSSWGADGVYTRPGV